MIRSTKKKSAIYKVNLIPIVAIVLLPSIGLVKGLYFEHPRINMIAGPYVAQKGCFVKSYALLERISPACINSRYVIPHDTADSYDWSPGRAGRDYYRVGDDAYQIRCDKDPPNMCQVVMTAYNAFSVAQ